MSVLDKLKEGLHFSESHLDTLPSGNKLFKVEQCSYQGRDKDFDWLETPFNGTAYILDELEFRLFIYLTDISLMLPNGKVMNSTGQQAYELRQKYASLHKELADPNKPKQKLICECCPYLYNIGYEEDCYVCDFFGDADVPDAFAYQDDKGNCGCNLTDEQMKGLREENKDYQSLMYADCDLWDKEEYYYHAFGVNFRGEPYMEVDI